MAEEKDPQDVAKAVVSNIKSGGLFDQFRRECIEALDKMEQYRQLQKRVENHVASFLSRQKWSENLSKNKLRENIRQHINQSEVIINGVQHLINEVLYDQASSFNSRIDLEVDKYLNSQRTREQKESQKDKHVATPGKSTDGVKCADSQESSVSDRSAISKHGEGSSTRYKPSSLKSCLGNEELPKNDPHGKDSVSKSRPSSHSSSSKSNPLVKKNPSSGAHSLTSDTHEVHGQSDSSPRPRTGTSDSPGSTREGNKRSQSTVCGSACEKLSVTSDSAVGQSTILSSISSETKTQKQTSSRDESAKTVSREKGMVVEKICHEQVMLCSGSPGGTERTHDDQIGKVGAKKEARSKPAEDTCSSNQYVSLRDTESSKPSICVTTTKKCSDPNDKCNTSTVQCEKVESGIVKTGTVADQCVDRSRAGVISSALGHSAKEQNSGASKDKIELENSACEVGSGSCGEGDNVIIDQDLPTFHCRMGFIITEQETAGDDFAHERSKRKKKACPTDDDTTECSDRFLKKKKCDKSVKQDDPVTISITVEKESGCESTELSYPENNEEALEAKDVGCSTSVGSKGSDEEVHEDVDCLKKRFNIVDTSQNMCGLGASDFTEGNETAAIQEEHDISAETETTSSIAKLDSPSQAVEEGASETDSTTGSDKIGTEASKHEHDIPTQVQTRGKRPRQASGDVDPTVSTENDDSETYRRKKRDKPSTLFSQEEYITSPAIVKDKGSLTAGRIPRQPRETTSVMLDVSATEPRGVRTRRTSTGESDDDRANERVERGRPRTKKLKSDSNPDKVMKRGTRGSTEKVDPLSQGVTGRPKRNVKPKRCYSPSENR